VRLVVRRTVVCRLVVDMFVSGSVPQVVQCKAVQASSTCHGKARFDKTAVVELGAIIRYQDYLLCVFGAKQAIHHTIMANVDTF